MHRCATECTWSECAGDVQRSVSNQGCAVQHLGIKCACIGVGITGRCKGVCEDGKAPGGLCCCVCR